VDRVSVEPPKVCGVPPPPGVYSTLTRFGLKSPIVGSGISSSHASSSPRIACSAASSSSSVLPLPTKKEEPPPAVAICVSWDSFEPARPTV
jgi:hypothetical protein